MRRTGAMSLSPRLRPGRSSLKASNAISNRNAPPTSPPKTADSSSSTAERFTLAGPSIVLDPAIHAYRNDLADVALAGQLFAPHYARPSKRLCGAQAAPVRAEPSEDSPILFD